MNELLHLNAFVSSITKRLVVLEGVGRFLVRPATVSEALRCYALAAYYEDPDVKPVLVEIFEGWLPAELTAALVKKTLPQIDRLAAVLFLLDTGFTAEVLAEKEDEVIKWVRARDWSLLIAEYRHVYPSSYREIMEEPWPFFMEQARQIDIIHAIEQVFWMGGYGSARSGKPEAIFRNAGYEMRVDLDEPDYMDATWHEKQIQAAKENAAALVAHYRRKPHTGKA